MSKENEPYSDEELAPALPREQAPSPEGSAKSSVLLRASSKSSIQKSTVSKRLKALDRRVEDLEHVNDEEEMEKLPQDTHSILMARKSHWISILFASGIYATQMFIYAVLLLHSPLNKNNPEDSFPNGVTVTIRVAQYIALFITVYTQQDTVDAVLLWKTGFNAISSYTPHEDSDIPVIGPRLRYQVCVFFRFVVGLMGMAATWVLIAQSDEAVDLLLNFTAVEFVAGLDGSAFELCLNGFFGKSLKEDAERAASVRYSLDENQEKKYSRRRYLLLIFLLLMIGPLMSLSFRQIKRKVGDNEVYVQFDDAIVPELSKYSGIYKGVSLRDGLSLERSNGAIIYEKKGASWPYPFFGYCRQTTRWIFFADPKDPENLPLSQKDVAELKLCEDNRAFLYSNMDGGDIKRSNEFDLLSHRGAQWLYQGKEKITEVSIVMVPSDEMQGFYKRVKDRQATTCGSGVRLTGEFGDHDFKLIEGPEDSAWFANRPQYVYNNIVNNNTDYILFNGYRWIYVTGIEKSETDVSVDRLNHKQVQRISEPVQYLSEKDTFFPSSDLAWYKAIDTVRPSSGKGSKDESFLILCEIECNPTDALLQFEITTDLFPSETYVALFSESLLDAHQHLNNTTPIQKKKETGSFTFSDTATYDVLQGGPFEQDNPGQSYSYRACVNKNETNYLVIRDTFGDGFQGSFRLLIDDKVAFAANKTEEEKSFSCTALSLDLPLYNTQGTLDDIVTPEKCSLAMEWISQDTELAGLGTGDFAFACDDFDSGNFCFELDDSGTPCDVCAVCNECRALCEECSTFNEQVLEDACSFCDSPTPPTGPTSPVAPTSPGPTVAPVSP